MGSGQSRRIECRLLGADANPYLPFAAAIASGIDGIEQQIEPPAKLVGDAYASDATEIETTLRAANDRFRGSADARRLFGDALVNHYGHHFAIEVAAYDNSVTHWERRRHFQLI